MHGLQTATGDEAGHGIQQFKPVFQRWMGYALPLIKTFFTMGKQPFAPDPLGIYLQLGSVFGNAFPTDFGFGHLG